MGIWWELDLTMPQFKVLMVLFSKGKTSVGEIAEILRVKTPNITWILDKLVEQELVERNHDFADRRVVYSQLTPKAKKLISQLIQTKIERFQRVLAKLTPEELIDLEKSLLALNQALEKEETNWQEQEESDRAHHCCR
jgi:DNA-binding MarR family transcriptional regulator